MSPLPTLPEQGGARGGSQIQLRVQVIRQVCGDEAARGQGRKSVCRTGSKSVESVDRNRYGCGTAGDGYYYSVAQAGAKGPGLHLNEAPGPMDRGDTGQGPLKPFSPLRG